MSRIQRVILDTSTLVSAALRRGSKPGQALSKALRTCELCDLLVLHPWHGIPVLGPAQFLSDETTSA